LNVEFGDSILQVKQLDLLTIDVHLETWNYSKFRTN